jgi:hypothetical protein
MTLNFKEWLEENTKDLYCYRCEEDKSSLLRMWRGSVICLKCLEERLAENGEL